MVTRVRWLPAALATLLVPAIARAQSAPPVISSGPERVAVTLYRDPERGMREIDRDSPTAFALISETRTVTLPPGVATVRFEGVASGIVPQSAILFGTDPRERNREASLLSHKGLVDAYTGQQVILRRTDPATGKAIEERATIRSAADRLVISTPRGSEAVYCSGLTQTLIYPGAPATLSAKPVLTMTTRDQPGGKVTITLAYIATGFDWDATYIGSLAPDGRSLDLFAWLTMASGDDTSFVDATAAAVAGRINRSEDTDDDTGREALVDARSLDRGAQCWSAGTTSDIASRAPPASPPLMINVAPAGADIIVTARRREERQQEVPIAVTAVAENLSDLKLYRIPVPVTVAARSQKQVAFLANRHVRGALVYRSRIYNGSAGDPELLFRFQNSERNGLGVPFPAGRLIMYQSGSRGRQLVGEATVSDKTTGEDVELTIGEASNVTIDSDRTKIQGGDRYEVTMRNANAFPVAVELEFINDADVRISGLPSKLINKPGRRTWAITLAPHAERKISYDVKDEEPR